MQFGSTDEDPIPKEELEKALGRRDKATLDGCLQELNIVKQKLENCYEKLGKMTELWGNTQKELQFLRAQYATLANVRVNTGPTQREE